jgi:hypothetical protein
VFARMRASVTYCDCFCVFCVIFFTPGALKPLSIAFIIFNFEVLHVLKASLDRLLSLLFELGVLSFRFLSLLFLPHAFSGVFICGAVGSPVLSTSVVLGYHCSLFRFWRFFFRIFEI